MRSMRAEKGAAISGVHEKRGQEPIVQSTLRAYRLLVPDPFSADHWRAARGEPRPPKERPFLPSARLMIVGTQQR